MNWMIIGKARNWQHFFARFIAAFIVFLLYFRVFGGQGILIDVFGAMVVVIISIWLVDKLAKRFE